MNFSLYLYLGPFLRYLATKMSWKCLLKCMDEILIFFLIKIHFFLKQFPFIWLNMLLEKCLNFMMDFSWYVYLGPILRCLATKIPRKLPALKCMGKIYGSFVSQNTKFSETVPTPLILYLFREMYKVSCGF